jgi:hypothetical protein
MAKKKNWYVNPKKFHFIYKTTCLVNGKFYYGMHSTDDITDGYVGSGTRLWHSIKKHGRSNFKIEILEFCSDRESLKLREAEIITEDMIKDPMCMNLRTGGEGGYLFTEEVKEKMKDRWTTERRVAQADRLRNVIKNRFQNYDYKPKRKKLSPEEYGKVRSKVTLSYWERLKQDTESYDKLREKMSRSAKERKRVPHTKESIDKMSAMKIGKKQQIVSCPHCGKSGGAATMPRWHFDNCKQYTKHKTHWT